VEQLSLPSGGAALCAGPTTSSGSYDAPTLDSIVAATQSIIRLVEKNFDRLKNAEDKDPSSRSEDANTPRDYNPIIAPTHRTTIEQNAVHGGAKSSCISEPACDHDLWYARITDAVTKAAAANREEIIEVTNTMKINATSNETLATTTLKTLKSCYDRIQQQEGMFDDFKAQMQRELEELKSKAGRCVREHLVTPQAVSQQRPPPLAWVSPHAKSPTQPPSIRIALRNSTPTPTPFP